MAVKATLNAKGADIEFGTVTGADPAAVATDAEGNVVLTIAGADTSDLVFITPRGLAAGLVIVEATVTAANTVTLKALNATETASIDDAASSFDYMLVKVAAA
jgi:hypothetical protein